MDVDENPTKTDTAMPPHQPTPAALHMATMRAKDAVEAAVRAEVPEDLRLGLMREFEARRSAEIAAQPLAQRRKLALKRIEEAAVSTAKFRALAAQTNLTLARWIAEEEEAAEALEAVDHDLAEAALQLHWSVPSSPDALAAEAAQRSEAEIRRTLEAMLSAMQACSSTAAAPGPLGTNMAALAQCIAGAQALLAKPGVVQSAANAAPPGKNAGPAEPPEAPASVPVAAPAPLPAGTVTPEAAPGPTAEAWAQAAAGVAAAFAPPDAPAPAAANSRLAAAFAAGALPTAVPILVRPTEPYVPQPRHDPQGRTRSRSPRCAAELAAAMAVAAAAAESQDAAIAAALQPRPTPPADVAAAHQAAAAAAATASATQHGEAVTPNTLVREPGVPEQ